MDVLLPEESARLLADQEAMIAESAPSQDALPNT